MLQIFLFFGQFVALQKSYLNVSMSKKWVLKDYIVRTFLKLSLCAPFMFYLNGIFLIVPKEINYLYIGITKVSRRTNNLIRVLS